MHSRPVSVLYAAWLLIITGVVCIVRLYAFVKYPTLLGIISPDEETAQILLGLLVVGCLVNIFCGIMLMRDTNWARHLAIICGAGIFLLVLAVAAKVTIIFAYMVAYGWIVRVLISKKVVTYFTRPNYNDYY